MDAMPRRDEGSLSFDQARGVWIGRYWVTLRTGKRQRKQVSHKDKKICQQKLAQALHRSRTEQIEERDPNVETWLQEWLDYHRESLKAKSVADYERSIKKLCQAIGRLKIRSLTPMAIEQAWLHEPGRTAQMMRARMRQAMSHAMRMGLLTWNPADATKQPKTKLKPKAIMTVEALDRVIELETNPVLRSLWMFLAYQGCRPWAEALPLRWSQIVEMDGLHWYRGAKTQAGERPRPIYPPIMEILEANRREGCDWVFPSAVGTMIGQRNGARSWKAALARAGVPYIEPYSLRRFAATMHLERHRPSAVAAYLGHSKEAVTQRYYEVVRESEVRRIVGG